MATPAHVLHSAVAMSAAESRIAWVIASDRGWRVVLAPRRGDRIVCHCCGDEIIADHAGYREITQ